MGGKSGMNTYTVPSQALAEMYLIQAEPAPQFTTLFEQAGVMYNEGSPDYFVDQGFYYPATTGYGCISPGDLENHQNVSYLDGQGIHYAGFANESLPHLYYTPTYEYTQCSYNPYNPYIPGATVGVDGWIVEPQQYCAPPSYENSVSLPGYMPVIIPSRADAIANGTAGVFLDNAAHASKVNVLASNHNLSSSNPNSSLTEVGDARKGRNSFQRVPDVGEAFNGGGKPLLPHGLSVSNTSLTSSDAPWTIGPRGTGNGLHAKGSSNSNQIKSCFTSAKGSSGFNSITPSRASIHDVNSKSLNGRAPNIARDAPQTLSELNQAPGTKKLKNELVLKAYTTKAGNPDAHGNITILLDQYSSIDLSLGFVNAKFFVIKSYSEDDVHKSIKYNVWSSTRSGNKRLNAAYEDAQGISAGDSRGCPVFLFFSVNASGQFCGVAEMTGPVDFLGDMDFWQQDKWTGSFPVKWHIIKDVPNPNFRHIILENNEYRPVTNSRDTQEIYWKQGLEMLQIFNNFTSKASLLDDFMYYENRQRILFEERTRIHIKYNENPSLVPGLYPAREFPSVHEFPAVGDVNCSKRTAQKFHTDTKSNSADDNAEVSCQDSSNGAQNPVEDLEISSLSLHSDVQESVSHLPSAAVFDTKTGSIDVVTIGSMPVRIAGPSPVLTVGTIPLDLQRNPMASPD